MPRFRFSTLFIFLLAPIQSAFSQGWQLIDPPFESSSARLYDLVVDRDRMFLSSMQGLYYTEDGATWVRSPIEEQVLAGSSGFFHGPVDIVRTPDGICLQRSTVLLRSTDGESWEQLGRV